MIIVLASLYFSRVLTISREVFACVKNSSSVEGKTSRCCRGSIGGGGGHGHMPSSARGAGGGNHAAARVAAHARHVVHPRADAD